MSSLMKKNKNSIYLLCLLGLIFVPTTGYSQTKLIINGGYLVHNDSTQIVLQNTQFINNAIFAAGAGKVILTGDVSSNESAIGGSQQTTFHDLEINKANNGVLLQQNITVNNELIMTSGNLDLNGDTCTLATANGILVGESENSRITGTSGGIIRKTMDLSQPNLVNPGNIGVAITSDEHLGSTLIERSHVAQTVNGGEGIHRSYRITPTNNAALNAEARFYYFDAELNGHPASDLGLWRLDSTFWISPATSEEDPANNYLASEGIDFFTFWTLAPKAPQLNARVFLEGPFDSSTAEMNDNLRSSNLIPTKEPYTDLGYNYPASGGSEVISPRILTTTGSNAIVDWVFVELRDPTNTNNVIAARAALLQKDGDVVDLDGKSPLSFSEIATNQTALVAIRHRNHLGIIAAAVSDLSISPIILDFASDPTLASGATAALSDLGNGAYGLFSGDFDGNGQIQNTDGNALTPTLGSSGYLPGDNDLNGQVQNTDLQIKLTPNLGRGAQFGY